MSFDETVEWIERAVGGAALVEVDKERVRIRVRAVDPNGFDVELASEGAELVVSFGEGWHEHFEDEEQARSCFLWGLTSRYRILEQVRSGEARKWTLERFQDGAWEVLSTVGLSFTTLDPVRFGSGVNVRSNSILEPSS